HHTADPAGAFAKLAALIKTGGSLSVWVYGKENNNWIIYGLNPLRKYITSHLPRPLLWLISYLLAIPLFLMIQLVYLPVSRSQRLGFLSRSLFYYDYLCWLGKHCGFQEQALVIFDHLVPEIAEYIPKSELISWFKNANFSHVTITSRANNSWRGFGVKER
ncbi:MAG: hypothetical protein K8I82_26595, partial [Anaerolineae bacterium]|nr:hypothetical protein [Anaerolineae bacterium]